MPQPFEVSLPPLPFERLEPVVGAVAAGRARERAAALRGRLDGRTVWNVNSTAAGGGVAEMLPSLIGYARGLGLDARWFVIAGVPPFFGLTKRLHHLLHGSPGDGGPLGGAERAVYEAVARDNAGPLLARVRPRDVVVLHDPQTAGLAPALAEAGATVIWRCHIGADGGGGGGGDAGPDGEAARGWAFLEPYLARAHAFVFTRAAYVPPLAAGRETALIAPSLDPFTPKNEELDDATAHAILVRAGLLDGEDAGPVEFEGADGAPRRVGRRAEVVREGGPPAASAPLVVQVSRWDPLKDPIGVMRGFASIAGDEAPGGAELVLAGPRASGVADDPEAEGVLAAVVEAWRALPEAARRRVHLASLPTDDAAENAATVNALQRRASVIVQKSLREGFGLTVAEGMWKARPTIASAVGGIRDQIADGEHGLLVEDPADLGAFAAGLRRLLADRALAARLGRAARERVRERFLAVRHLGQYADLIERVGA